jgi:hypothetical protein
MTIDSRIDKEKATAKNVRPFGLFRCGFSHARINIRNVSYCPLAGMLCIFGALVLGLSGCTVTPDGVQQFDVPMEEIFPPSKTVASYRQLKKPEKIDAKAIEEQIGSAQKYSVLKKWGALSTLMAEYGIPDRPVKARVTVTEMGSKQNAYGAYSNIRPGLLADANYVKIGVHGTVDADRLIFVQDRYLIAVRDLSGDVDPTRRTMLINFGRAISDRIPRDITDIDLVGDLPTENRVPATERLDKEDPLGMGLFKGGGVTALYRIENRECKVFLCDTKENSDIKGLVQQVKAAMEKEAPTSELGIGVEGYQGRLFKSQAMLALRENTIFGCYGTMTEREMKNIMAAIDRHVKPAFTLKAQEKKPEEDENADKDKTKGKGPGY